MDKLLAMLKKLGAKDDEIEAAREELEAEATAATEKLQKKNTELIGELRKAKGTGNEEVTRLQDEVETLKGQLTEVTKAKTKLEKDLGTIKTDLETQLAGERAAIARSVLEEGLTKELTAAGVKPAFLPAVSALIKSKGVLSVKSEGDVRKAVALLKKDGKDQELDLSAYIKNEWANSDEGKEFIPAGGNSGGSAKPGQGGGGSSKTMTRAAFDALDPASQVALSKEKVVLTD